jgi:hypothetical protein
MTEDFSNLDKEEQIAAENDYIKMKLMLEKGAEFGAFGEEDVNPEIENIFLKNVMEYERQFDQQKMIRVFDKIGRPAHFKPVAEIPDAEIKENWNILSEHLFRHGISLGVCSPNVSTRELYRFATEELFNYEMDDISVPGMVHGFIYDEFYPDIPYENTRAAVNDCIPQILSKELIEWAPHYRNENLRLNGHYPLTEKEFFNIVNRFKTAYDDLEPGEITGVNCKINENHCSVTGNYSLRVNTGIESADLSGKWEVVLEFMSDYGYWYITEVNIENINF